MTEKSRIKFIERPGAPERLICDAELHLGGDLEGLKLVGFTLWRSAEGEPFASVPSRAFGVGGGRRYFDLLRPANGEGPEVVRKLKARIIREWKRERERMLQVEDEHPLGGLL